MIEAELPQTQPIYLKAEFGDSELVKIVSGNTTSKRQVVRADHSSGELGKGIRALLERFPP